jgi:hypothetical protein
MNILSTTIRGALVAVLLGGALLAGTGRAAADVQCALKFMPTKPMVGVGSIIATAGVTCDVPPEQHELRLALDMFVSGEGWQTEKMDSFDQIPRPNATYQVKTACVPGMWRMQAEAVGTLGGKPFDYAVNSMPRRIVAQECARGGN